MAARPFLVNVADLVGHPGAHRRERLSGSLGPLRVVDASVPADAEVVVDTLLEWVSDGVLALGLVAQAAERDRVDDPLAVALEGRAVAPLRRGVERELAAAAGGRIGGVRRPDHPPPRIQSAAASAWIRVPS